MKERWRKKEKFEKNIENLYSSLTQILVNGSSFSKWVMLEVPKEETFLGSGRGRREYPSKEMRKGREKYQRTPPRHLVK